MGRSLFTGYGVESVGALATVIAEAKASDPLAPVTVVPPGNHSGLDLRRRLGRDGGLVNVRFMVLARLAEFLGVEGASEGRRPLTTAVRAEAVRVALAQVPTMFSAVAAHPATVSAMDAAFRELAEVPAQELEHLAAAGARAADVVRLFERFRELTRRYYDRPTLFDSAAHAVMRDPRCLRDIGHVIAILPGTLTPAQRRFVGALNGADALTALVGLTADRSVDVESEEFARELGVGKREDAGDVPMAARVVAATDPDEEVRTVVALVLEALGAGVPAAGIACYYGDAGVYRALLVEQMRAVGIPHNEPSGETIASTPPGRLLLGLLRLAREGLSRRALLDWLSAAPVRDGARAVPVRTWNRISRDAGVVGGNAARWRASLDHFASEIAARREDAVEAGREGLSAAFDREIRECAALGAFVESLESAITPPASSRWVDWIAWARNRLERYLDRLPGNLAADSALESLNSALDELTALDALDAGGVGDLEAFESAVTQSLAASALTPPARFGSGVFVAPIGLAAGVFFRETFVLGAVEGQLPGSDREDPLISDSDRRSAPSLPQGAGRKRALRRAYLAALAGSTHATVSYPEASLRIGRKQLPSRWLLESASRHEGETVDAEAFGSIRSRPWLIRQVSMSARLASDLPKLTGSEYDLADIRSGAGLDAVVARTPQLAAGVSLVQSRRSSRFTRYDGHTGPGDPDVLPPLLSPTRLERWARCPFQHFAGDILRIAEFDEPEEIRALSALDRGSIIHDALDAFYRETAGRQRGPWTIGERVRLTELALERCSEYERLGRTGVGALWNIERARILSDLADFLDADETRSLELGTRFYSAELAFGETARGLPAVAVALPDGRTLTFRGRIDRVDRVGDTDAYWVYDYKTGSAYGMERLEADPLLGGQRLQLPIYGEAVRAGLGATEVRAGYWFVSANQGFRLRDVPVDESTRSMLRSTLATIRDGIAGGVFAANSGSGSRNCTYCAYDSLCLAERERAFQRKSQDEAMAPYRALTEPPGDA